MSFRRFFTVLSLLTLFVGLACAQGTTVPMTCTTGSGTVTPLIRAEGYTELIGDIVITCTGGSNTIIPGNAIPQTNIVISVNAPVTSRLLGNNNASEALLLIDEPGSGQTGPVPGFGPNAAQVPCGSVSGCVEYAQSVTGTDGHTYAVASSTQSTSVTPQTGANVFQGTVSGNTITFNGVPILPPASGGITRTFRITNVRINAASLGGPTSSTGVSQVYAYISTNGSTSLPLGNAQQVAGFIQGSLRTGFYPVGSSNTGVQTFQQCLTTNVVGSDGSLPASAKAGSVKFTENFATAFKTRVFPGSNAGSGQGTGSNQNIPGSVYNSESGFIFPAFANSNGTSVAGLADFGTRLKAVFTNIPAGVSALYVSLYNTDSGTVDPTILGSATTTSYARAVTGETVSDNGSPFPAKTNSGPATPATSTTPAIPGTPLILVPVGTDRTATAFWEVVNTNSSAPETYSFDVYVAYTASNNPVTGIGQVALSYAPSPNTGGFTAAAAGAPSSRLAIPRFMDGTAVDALKFTTCTTVLLWPYVTTLTGFDTGFAIANTSLDPASVITSGATPQSGTCALYIYGTDAFGTKPTNPINLPLTTDKNPDGTAMTTIAAGTVYANSLGTLFSSPQIAPGGYQLASGYMFGVCNFQYAHGYAAISDPGAKNFVTSYLALVVQGGTGAPVLARGQQGEAYNQ